MIFLNAIDLAAVGVKASQFILSFSILVVLHELGHFIPARLFKTRVEKFYLFFNPGFSLWKKKIGETEYGIGWIPFGGYVKISGMIDESMDKEQMQQPPQPWEFRSKPAWQRLIIMIGGVTVNVLLAFVIYAMTLFVWGDTKLPNKPVEPSASIGLANYSNGLGLASSLRESLSNPNLNHLNNNNSESIKRRNRSDIYSRVVPPPPLPPPPSTSSSLPSFSSPPSSSSLPLLTGTDPTGPTRGTPLGMHMCKS